LNCHNKKAPSPSSLGLQCLSDSLQFLSDFLQGVELPHDPELATDLTLPQYGYSRSQVQLKRKEDMKSRGLASPDAGDTLVMSFSVKVDAQPKREARPQPLAATDHAWMY
jgi:hypothetical protein